MNSRVVEQKLAELAGLAKGGAVSRVWLASGKRLVESSLAIPHTWTLHREISTTLWRDTSSPNQFVTVEDMIAEIKHGIYSYLGDSQPSRLGWQYDTMPCPAHNIVRYNFGDADEPEEDKCAVCQDSGVYIHSCETIFYPD